MVLDNSQRYLVGEYAEDYHEGRIGRREMLRRTLATMGSVAAAAAALREVGVDVQGAEAAGIATPTGRSVRANVATAAMRAAGGGEPGARTMPPPAVSRESVVAPTDPDIVADMVELPGEAGTIFAYLARPSRSGRLPAVIVNHDSVGLAEPMLDIARRYAKEGYVALIVDLASRGGGTAAVVSGGGRPLDVAGRLSDDERAADMNVGVAYLQASPFVNTSIGLGTTGFCFGGNQSFLLAVRNPAIVAAVPYYGTVEPSTLAQTRAAILAFYGEDDTRVTAQAPEVEAALAEAGRPHEIVIYPSAGHAFFFNFDDRYRPGPSQDAWRRTMAWFARYLSP